MAVFTIESPSGYIVETQIAQPPADAKKPLKQKKFVVTPKVGLSPARFGMTKQDIIQAFGQPDSHHPYFAVLGEKFKVEPPGEEGVPFP